MCLRKSLRKQGAKPEKKLCDVSVRLNLPLSEPVFLKDMDACGLRNVQTLKKNIVCDALCKKWTFGMVKRAE